MTNHCSSSGNGHPTAAKCRLVYERSQAIYASQFVVHANAEAVVLDCSSGMLPAAEEGEATLPIHTRLALSWNAAARLEELLRQALAARAAGSARTISQRSRNGAVNPPTNGRAHLPPLDESHG